MGVLAACALLAACGGGNSATATATAGAPRPTTMPSATTVTPAGATATGAPTVTLTTTGALAPYLSGPDGRTLYVFARDAANTSNCSGACAQNWPPLTIAAGVQPTGGAGVTGPLDAIERADGTRQVTYDGAPLYYFHSDRSPGDTLGNGLAGLWSVAKPGLTPPAAGAASATPTPTASAPPAPAGY